MTCFEKTCSVTSHERVVPCDATETVAAILPTAVRITPRRGVATNQRWLGLTLGNPEFLQRGNDLVRVLTGIDFLFNVFNRSVLADVESPAFWNRAFVMNHAVRLGDVLFRVAQDRIVQLELLGVPGIGFYGITAGCEETYIKLVES